MQKKISIILFLIFIIFFVLPGCNTTHEVAVKPIEIKPIHITIDVNIRVEKALDDFFGDLDKKAKKLKNQ